MDSQTPTTLHNFHARFISSLADIDADAWNGLCGADYPFLQHDFLLALEESRCTIAITGWQPFHLLVYEDDKETNLLALMPLYKKANSYGEYVFDWSWADAYKQHGLQYYPKLLTAIPFTPSAGPRICFNETANQNELLTFIVARVKEETLTSGASGWHVLFPEKELSQRLIDEGCQQRLGCQYQWFNHGYTDFDDFLKSFTSRKRKNIRKERQKVQDAGITFQALTASAIEEEHWLEFFKFYQSTYFVRGRNPYLNLDFFQRLGKAMPEKLLLVLAFKDEQAIAGALSLIGSDTLYGRFWGCTEEYQFLHFETCYYQGIDYCLKTGLKRFDSGAQGEHKIQRGFEPVSTWSNHWLAHSGFNEAIEKFLEEEESYIERYISHAGEFLPFKKETNPEPSE